eukprot:Pompholyxophrys_punicea_v1_NODE_415_length_2022_cov_2.241484.p2 type:complete len:113 gc:universal NODE_415_length_2022_cov_2.241484:883-1221(+)
MSPRMWVLARSIHWIEIIVSTMEPQRFRENFRMFPQNFRQLLNDLSPFILRQTTHWRKPISPHKRLLIVLYFLGHGCSFPVFGRKFWLWSYNNFPNHLRNLQINLPGMGKVY